MTEEYTVDDWIEFRNYRDRITEMDDDMLTDYETDILSSLNKALAFIKEQLGIRTEPRVVESMLSPYPYLTNIWVEREDGLVIAHSKRKATKEEIEQLGVWKKEETK